MHYVLASYAYIFPPSSYILAFTYNSSSIIYIPPPLNPLFFPPLNILEVWMGLDPYHSISFCLATSL